MSLITFLNTERLTVATRKLVYKPDEINAVTNVVHQAESLQELLDYENDRVEAAIKQGRVDGYERGQEEGYEAALEHIAVKLVVLAKEANVTRESIENSAGDLAIRIVEKIATDVGRKEMIVALARTAASELTPKEPIVLRVHPENVQHMEENSDHLDGAATRIVNVVGDYSLGEDDCVLETEFGQVKADLQTQLKVLREKMYGNE